MGYTMKRCKTCQVTILDPTMVCPLCHSVLEAIGERTGTKANGAEAAAESQERRDLQEAAFQREAHQELEEAAFQREAHQELEEAAFQTEVRGMYPDDGDTAKRLNFIVKLYTFLAIVIEGGLIAINYATYSGLWWSAICGIAILYFYMTLRYSIQKNSGYLRIILTQVFAAALLAVGVDWIIGYRGWSVNYVAPSAVLLIDLAVVILMLVNMANWQSYILLQILTVILSGILLLLWGVGVLTQPVVVIVAAAVSAVLFAGTIIFGDRRAKNELKRRFHV